MLDCNQTLSCFQAIDVFASFSTSAANRLGIMREITRLWGVIDAETLYPVNKPVVQVLLIVMWFYSAIDRMCMFCGLWLCIGIHSFTIVCTMFRS